MRTIAIIGGGAAGLMTAASIIESGVEAEIHLFEKNPILGAKVIISGGGRCNVTTGITDRKLLLTKYTRGREFIKTAIYDFPPEKVFEWFEEHGVPLKCEDDLRVFPKSDHGKDVVGVFEKLFLEKKVDLHVKNPILTVEKVDGGFFLKAKSYQLKADVVVLTCGGEAYQHTGSTGDGYSFAKSCGHTVTRLGPSLSSFKTKETWPHKLSGISFEKAKLKSEDGDGSTVEATGPFLFTHFGISGPVTFTLSSHLAFTAIDQDNPRSIRVIPNADRGEQEWEKLLKQEFTQHGARLIITILDQFFPARFAEAILELAQIPSDKKSAELSREERQKIVKLLGEGLSLTLLQRRPGDEFVTAGGIPTTEVDSKTMQSKLCPGLFFAGEILNVDGITGGFNLQWAWASGRRAGEAILREGNSENA